MLTLAIESLASTGEGVAHAEHDGVRRTVFVPFAAPGDEVRGEIDFGHRPARAARIEVVRASAIRVEPPCPVAGRCGGCDWMHIAVTSQAELHAELVRGALSPAGPVPTVVAHAATAPERYRTRARLHIEARDGMARLGFRAARSRVLEPINRCLVLDQRLEPALDALTFSFEGERGDGEAHLALGAAGRPVVSVSWEPDLGGTCFARLEDLVAREVLAGAEVRLRGARLPAHIGNPEAATIGGDGRPLAVPAASFAQANPAVNLQLVRRAVELLAPAGHRVVELFAGAGNFTVALAPLAKFVIAVEADTAAIDAARRNAAARGLTPRFVQADADEFELPAGVDAVLLDPPRGGAAGAAAHVGASRAQRVLYVSCNPVTLARDSAALRDAGFSLDAVETFEMFPHTSHVETIALFTRAQGSRRRGVGSGGRVISPIRAEGASPRTTPAEGR